MYFWLSAGRILYGTPCEVCRDHSSGKHYGIYTCDGCAGFFKRSIRKKRQYACKSKPDALCQVDKTHRNQCRACRLKKCIKAGMNRDAVQHERGPRNSTIRKQMAMSMSNHDAFFIAPPMMARSMMTNMGLDLTVPRIGNPFLTTPTYLPNFSSSNGSPPSAITSTPPPQTATQSHLHHITSSPQHTFFQLPPPEEVIILEHAASVLMINVTFLKTLTPFVQLTIPDQFLLLEESWREFFIIGIAESQFPINFARLFVAYNRNMARHIPRSESSTAIILQELNAFQAILNKFSQMNIDRNEYVYLRSIALYKTEFSNNSSGRNNNNNETNKDNSQDIITSTSDDSSSDLSHNNSTSSSSLTKTLQEPFKVKALESNARESLANYERHYLGIEDRYKNLLALLPSLKLVSHKTIEELFFRRVIGDGAPLLTLLLNMYKQTRP